MITKKIAAVRLALVVAAGLAASTVSSFAQSATAIISATPAGGGSFDYVITLDNTGTLDLNGFWYGWTVDGNNLPSIPNTLGNSLGWDNTPSGKSVMWQNSTGTALSPGHTATFTFVSTSSPTAFTTAPAGESVAYVSGIDLSQGAPGDSTGVFSPTLVPEPSPMAILAVGLVVITALFRSSVASRKVRSQSPAYAIIQSRAVPGSSSAYP